MLAAIIEAADAPARRRLYLLLFAAVLVAATLLRPVRIELGPPGAPFSDFDYFHAAGVAVLEGDFVRAYDEGWFRSHQARLYGQDLRGPWSYPPPFGLVVAPFGLFSRGWAMLLFMLPGLLAYLWTVRRLAGARPATALLLLLGPCLGVTLFGQNGFLTGTLGGLTALGLAERRRWAGVPLGLMVIKPHLALGFGLYALVRRDWPTLAIAAGTAAAAAGLATLAFGAAVWPAFAAAVRFAGDGLAAGYFPLASMVSAYAAAATLGLPAAAAMAVQAASAGLAAALIIVAALRLPVRQAVGLTAFATVLISPYAFAYDLLTAGAGLALLLPDVVRLGRPWERSALYALFVASACFSLVQDFRAVAEPLPALPAFGLWACVALLWRMLARDRETPAARAAAQ